MTDTYVCKRLGTFRAVVTAGVGLNSEPRFSLNPLCMSEDYESVAMSIGVKGELIRTSPHLY